MEKDVQERHDRNVQRIRTYLPAMVAVLLARLVVQVPALAEGIATIDAIFAEAGWVGFSVLTIVQAVVLAAVILLYQVVAQKLGDRWQWIERLMLGSASRPTYQEPPYTPRHSAG